jgi:hypothetical protein
MACDGHQRRELLKRAYRLPGASRNRGPSHR